MSQAALQVTSGHANRASCPSGHELRKSEMSEAGRFSVFLCDKSYVIYIAFVVLLGQVKDCRIAARYLKHIKRGLPVSPNHFWLLVYMLCDCYRLFL